MDWLRQMSIFSDLSDQELDKIANIVHARKFPRDTFVFHEGDEREAVYFVRSGIVKVSKLDEDGREQIVSFLQSGDMFPHVGFFDDAPYPGTAQTIEASELAAIPIREFEHLLLQQPKIFLKVTRVLGRKILELQQKLQDVTIQNAYDRIVHALLHLCKQNGLKVENGFVLSFRLTNRELANMIGTSRETVNRVLNDLRKQGSVDFVTEGIWVSDQLIKNQDY
ncbi:Crp/Fnr family transcriptional regulator [Fodinisporobacter ferrooxydans]|uniref:Crp/Fnr family transcriptional regulator n=1 Tax=Fodinisporobacter ferrooxydans TaxID=2901836 RepID=A0ABY4CM60_9BACL|nr:Crp/Fnr family transcriptional regulator [Alicyclobacillaceae bacterium MYW30-H2]